jgi:hypothetical protein
MVISGLAVMVVLLDVVVVGEGSERSNSGVIPTATVAAAPMSAPMIMARASVSHGLVTAPRLHCLH